MSHKFYRTGRFEDHRWTSDGNWVNVGGDRNWRNNNPGNIESGRFAEMHGAIGSDGRFAIFPDYGTGKEALISLMKTKTYAGLSVAKAIARFAPHIENDTPGYVAFVHSRVGINLDAPIAALTKEELAAVVAAIETFEGGRKGITYHINDPNTPERIAKLGEEFDTSERGG